MTKYVVTAAVVVAKTNSDTGEGYFYKDAVLPDAGSSKKVQENHEFLADAGLVKRVDNDADEAPADDKPGESWTVEKLRAYAEEHKIDLGDAKLKADILAKVNGV